MRALTLDYRRQPRASWVGIALLIASASGAVVLGSQYARIVEQAAQAEADIREHGAATRKKVAAPAAGDVQKVALEVKHAREILLQLGMPWNDLFASVERGEAPNVALLRVESDIDKQRLKISAEAKDIGAMVDYLRDLEGRPTFADVYLQSHQFQQQDPQHPVRFVITATWLVRR
jgi:hypothetical protein